VYDGVRHQYNPRVLVLKLGPDLLDERAVQSKMSRRFELLVAEAAAIIMGKASCVQSLSSPVPILQKQPQKNFDVALGADSPDMIKVGLPYPAMELDGVSGTHRVLVIRRDVLGNAIVLRRKSHNAKHAPKRNKLVNLRFSSHPL
jgi:hypothetical protein